MTTPYNSCTYCGGTGHAQAACPWREVSPHWVAADLANSTDKRTWHQRNDAAAMRLQIQTQDKGAQA